MMASAFYPTGDGFVGDLGKKSLLELKDLFARQERLIQKNRKILQSLPDKGAKILQFAETLQRTIKSREKSELIFGKTDPIETKSEILSVRKAGHRGMSRFKKDKEKVIAKDEHRIQNEDFTDTMKTQSEPVAFTGDVLERSFQKLTVGDDGDPDLDIKKSSSQKPLHYYQVAEEKAKQNATGLREPLKLNRSLKVSAVHDLPVKFAPSNSVTHKKQLDTESLLPSKNSDEVPSHTHQRVQEETAATPPTYKYEKAKQISLEESLMLQKSQKEKQDVLQSEIAAERLAEGLHIKLEPYSPEGIDMSYRVSHRSRQTDLIDSDDDEYDDDQNDDAVKIFTDSDDDS